MTNADKPTLEQSVVDIPKHHGLMFDGKMIGHIDVYVRKGKFSGEVQVNPRREVLAEAASIVHSFFSAAYRAEQVDIETLTGGMLLPDIPYHVKFSGKVIGLGTGQPPAESL